MGQEVQEIEGRVRDSFARQRVMQTLSRVRKSGPPGFAEKLCENNGT
jgi:hypothetical protein